MRTDPVVRLVEVQVMVRLAVARLKARATHTHQVAWKEYARNPLSRIVTPGGGPVAPDLRPQLDDAWTQSQRATLHGLERWLVRKAKRQGLVLCEVPRVLAMSDLDGYLNPGHEVLIAKAWALPRAYQEWTLAVEPATEYLFLSKEALARGWVTLEPYTPRLQRGIPHGAVR